MALRKIEHVASIEVDGNPDMAHRSLPTKDLLALLRVAKATCAFVDQVGEFGAEVNVDFKTFGKLCAALAPLRTADRGKR